MLQSISELDVAAAITKAIEPVKPLADLVAKRKERDRRILATIVHDIRSRQTARTGYLASYIVEIDILATSFPMTRDEISEFIELHAENAIENEVADEGLFRRPIAKANADDYTLVSVGDCYVTVRCEVDVEADEEW